MSGYVLCSKSGRRGSKGTGPLLRQMLVIATERGEPWYQWLAAHVVPEVVGEGWLNEWAEESQERISSLRRAMGKMTSAERVRALGRAAMLIAIMPGKGRAGDGTSWCLGQGK